MSAREVLRATRSFASIRPAAHAVGTITGVGFETTGYGNVKITLAQGTIAAGVTGGAVTIEESDLLASAYTAIVLKDNDGVTVTVAALAANDDTDRSGSINFHARPTKKFIRAIFVPGGTGTSELCIMFEFGNRHRSLADADLPGAAALFQTYV